MLSRAANPVTSLPAQYREVSYLSLNERGRLLWLNLLSLIPLVLSGAITLSVLRAYHHLGAPLVIGALPDDIPMGIGIALALLVLPLHEWVHGLMIRYTGHRPRYGVKLLVLYATSDGGLFRRNEFIAIALAPLIALSLVGMAIALFLPIGLAQWPTLAVMFNAAGAVGDLWMAAAALRFDPSALIRDEEDSMRVFARIPAQI
ncbi:MAG TPA: DUF3267 domain-containing protein [Aggregatilinea sp.]|uniref:DUF3267 domain-containing protein n=1 Tax=Aggregatilinea sp. TaxID=2806333 RepID=UPI002BFA400E|nr:DUF3267 domain-containing protein [Aggregatilinea sp.]HML21561.1 DUF3267 domain-containing protein [Aggregatilinea sp.]